ncbi:uncharacterized protein LOC129607950 [Condylostylus longicornis]|uniref:uncharacterized protein LOC129607950 n=1 Tax=Condylostylus longicornis TaxID=2530218 RepID=UPI00244DCC59|nr:uncharacterized protein LOC129607950 [Condylostylus longicornis]
MHSNKTAVFKPESSEPYINYVRDNKVKRENGKKKDKENVYLNVGILSEVKGSAYMEYEQTKVLAVIFPPQEPTKSKNPVNSNNSVVHVDVSIPMFATKDYKFRNQNQRSLAIILKKAIEPIICRQEFSTFKVCIHVFVLEHTEHIESTAFNCCVAALAEGGIPIYDLYASSPSNVENLLRQNNKLSVYSKDLAVNQVTNCFQKGYMTLEEFKRALNENLEQNEKMLNLIRSVLINKIKNKNTV